MRTAKEISKDLDHITELAKKDAIISSLAETIIKIEMDKKLLEYQLSEKEKDNE